MREETQGRSLEDRLLFRRQFIIGPRFVEGFDAWRRITIGSRFCLLAHPDLPITQPADGDRSLTLLGYALDPDDPEATDDDIVRRLLPTVQPPGTLLSAVSRLGGRWVLVADTSTRTTLVMDAGGFRHVHYTDG